MVTKYCRRIWWVRFIRWTIAACVLILVTWTYRSWVLHGYNLLSSSEYRECQRRRDLYSAGMAGNQNHRQKLFVTMAYHGRLGNWMFQYAALLGIAEKNGFTPYLSRWHSLSDNFQLTEVRSTRADCLMVVEDPKPMSYVERLNNLPKANITIDGYFQSWKYFRSINDRIRKEFRFTFNMQQIIRAHFEDYVGRHVRAGREVISIHVRRGDVLKPGFERLGFKSAPAEYFANAMRYMIKRHPFSVFLIVSDDIEWCRSNIGTVVLKYYDKNKVGEQNRNIGDDAEYASSLTKLVVVNGDGVEEPLDPDAKNADKLIKYMLNERRIETNNDDKVGSVYVGSPPLIIAPLSSSINDFGLLTLANHSIMSVGSFGWWGAWLAGGDVVYYEDWPREGHVIYYEFTRDDFFPPNWVPISRGSRVTGIAWTGRFYSNFTIISGLVLALLAYFCNFNVGATGL